MGWTPSSLPVKQLVRGIVAGPMNVGIDEHSGPKSAQMIRGVVAGPQNVSIAKDDMIRAPGKGNYSYSDPIPLPVSDYDDGYSWFSKQIAGWRPGKEITIKVPPTLSNFLYDDDDVSDAFESRGLGEILGDLHDQGATVADLEHVVGRYRDWEALSPQQRIDCDHMVI